MAFALIEMNDDIGDVHDYFKSTDVISPTPH
jgi:hypothetical protein